MCRVRCRTLRALRQRPSWSPPLSPPSSAAARAAARRAARSVWRPPLLCRRRRRHLHTVATSTLSPPPPPPLPRAARRRRRHPRQQRRAQTQCRRPVRADGSVQEGTRGVRCHTHHARSVWSVRGASAVKMWSPHSICGSKTSYRHFWVPIVQPAIPHTHIFVSHLLLMLMLTPQSGGILLYCRNVDLS